MRFSPPAIAAALALTTVSSIGLGRSEPARLNPRSVALVEQGMAAQKAGHWNQAIDLFESALAVDPRNRAAYVRMAEIAHAQNLDGKAIRLYAQALAMDDKDVAALSGQGIAYAEKGAIQRAQDNLAKVKLLCTGRCPEAAHLATAIEQAGKADVKSAEAVQPQPTIEQKAAVMP